MQFSANLGFLWNHLPLPSAIEKAAASGFDAVEFHWPYDYSPSEITAVLDENDLPAIGINAPCGDRNAGEFGIAALEGRENEACAGFDQALAYAGEIGCKKIHVLSGILPDTMAAETVFAKNLEYACRKTETEDISVLIEPINTIDVPGYFLSTLARAQKIIERVGANNLQIMFDCYHIGRISDDVFGQFESVAEHVGHVQIAGVPDRAEPNKGFVDYSKLLPAIAGRGWSGCFGAEYRPYSVSEPDLNWLAKFRNL